MTARGPKVLVAMSGGVDSSVAAAMLLRAGHEVVGCFMRLGDAGGALDGPVPAGEADPACPAGGEDGAPARPGHRGCCSVGDAADARLVAAELGIPLYVCNFRRDFGRVIDYFAAEYAAGRTPNPCIRCNDWLKFGRLHEHARRLGAAFVASGHYARVERRPGRPERLLRGVDHAKDQSYVLFGVPRPRLAEMLLPIGDLHKPAVRDLARTLGLPVFDKPDSQEICFVPGDDYAAVVERRVPGARAPGPIRDESGRVIGAHAGQHRFTIGQRRGVGLAVGRPVYVVARDARDNSVTVGPRPLLRAERCTAGEANWLGDSPAAGGWSPCLARIRSNSAPVSARVRALADALPGAPSPSGRGGRFEVRFDAPQEAVAAGQAIVLYDADEPEVVLGGGWVERADAPASP